MKVKELIQKLQLCNLEFDVVLAEAVTIREDKSGDLEKVSATDAGEGDWSVRVDNALNQVFQDENNKEVCIFASRDNENNSIIVEPQTMGLTEITIPDRCCGGCCCSKAVPAKPAE